LIKLAEIETSAHGFSVTFSSITLSF